MPANLLLLSTADTDLLAASQAQAGWKVANPARVEVAELPALLDGVEVVVVRLLGGRRAWEEGLDAVIASGRPVVVLSGEAAPDAELMSLSTVPAGAVTEALAYLREGGSENLRNLAGFLRDTLLLTGDAFDPPHSLPTYGVRAGRSTEPDGRPVVGIVYYRAHEISGNTAFVDALADAVDAAGAQPLPIYCGTLRGLDPSSPDNAELFDLLRRCDTLVTTLLAAGGTVAANASAGGSDDAWDAGALASLDIPLIQGLALTSTREQWLDSDAAISPLDAATQVAIPEFDGRIITIPFSFKAYDAEGIASYRPDPERCERLAGIAVAHARLRHVPPAEKKLALVLSSYPTKHARIGNAVGLDTPASAVVLLGQLKDAGYDLGPDLDLDDLQGAEGADGLIHRLIAAGGHDVDWLTDEQLASAVAKIPLSTYAQWFGRVPETLRDAMTEAWGEAPGSLYVDTTGPEPAIALAALRFGNVVLMIQPPRGFGENPVAIYHDPDMAPSHHYLAAYRWLEAPEAEGGFGAHAVVHLGKHGTLEWLPGKGIGMAADCAPDAVLGNLPLVYPFIVNDPGEGTQAKRRGHAVVVDHLVPPMARAETYGDMAKLEYLLDEYATVQALDPEKVPTLRAQIWTLIQAAQLHHDLHTDEKPDDEEFDEFVLHLDGYLCEIKDVQIRDGLHVLGGGPVGEARVNLVLAILRASQMWGGASGAVPGLRKALGETFDVDEAALLADPGRAVPAELAALSELADLPAVSAADGVDLLEAVARKLVLGMETLSWDAAKVPVVVGEVLGRQSDGVETSLRFACEEVVPRLARTGDELTNVLRALDGRFVEAGPSGSPTRGLVNVLPTGRNFYAVDPKAIPSRNAWDVGVALADSLLARHKAETGEWPRSVGLTVWGTSAMRTQGDDLAEVLWLLGCRPVWDEASRRVSGFEVVPVAELGRPRIDVTVRISGFFRDAFPHVVAWLDEAVRTVAELDEDAADNYLRAHVLDDVAAGNDMRSSTARVFGSKPGSYGAGLLPLVDARNWRTDAELAEVYAVWGGYAYGKDLDGAEARPSMERAYARIQVAAKNADTREHDIMDSDDYFQYHGGMVAMVRHLTGANPKAYIGDSAVPAQVKTRTLEEETKRVFRARVVNPRWMAAMQRHGYKGAFEMAATVDYLFGYDATAGVVDDWMYETLTTEYVANPEVAEFFRKSNPWARHGIAERLLEAAQRGLWAEPSAEALETLRSAVLETEGDIEDRG
ncbi:cobaltochelatase subunit CobN [Kribbella sp. ALI-6-A]|uniref:cobaltochelatase subunit CobN n=1 Tax=Kribbella sp. ALI-6-A TaxID=1933817 RepID=UPI00097C2F4C|nr:cobaltochelatase subunit CobN [Kribbella sp. ALI-6-A]ONI69499.1 cobaltochelatase subunit CobN [Kribbella sp. ALI-6-A]